MLELVADAVEKLGAAGVRREAKILYLAITTRLLSHPFRPAHVLVKGASAGGKNYLVDVVVRLMPESAVYKMTGMSDRALAYLTEPMAHRFIILAEAAAIEDSEVALALVRSLLSEGEIRYPTVEKDENGKLATVLKHLEGPTGLIMTTTVAAHPRRERDPASVDQHQGRLGPDADHPPRAGEAGRGQGRRVCRSGALA